MKKPDRSRRPSSDSSSAFSGRSGADRPQRSGPGGKPGGGKARPYGTRPTGDGEGERRGPRKPYGTRDESRPSRDGGDRKPFRSRTDRQDEGNRRDEAGGHKPRPQTPYQRRSASGDGSFEKREGGNRDFKPRQWDGERGDRPERSSEGRSFDKRSGGQRDFKSRNRDDRPEGRSSGEKSYGKRDGGPRDFKPRNDRHESGDKPYRSRREDGEREAQPRFGRRPDEAPKQERREDDKDRGPRRQRIERQPSRDRDEDTVPAPETGSGMTLNKYLAHSGISARREAGDLVKAGKVTVNGTVNTNPGYRVQEGDTVEFEGRRIVPQVAKVYVLLNKPKGFITTTDDEQDRRTVMELVEGVEVERLYPVGRLDRNTTGVLLLTNDGDLAQKLTHPKYEAKKIYQVTLNKDLTKADFETILSGVSLEDGEARADKLAYLETKNEIGLEIHSGRNRIVRRMFESLGYEVEKLDRVMFAGLTKKNVPRGKWRLLTEREVLHLKHFKS